MSNARQITYFAFHKREDDQMFLGQSSILSRPVILVLTISVMLILLYSIYTSGGIERLKEREIDLRTVGTNTLLILANSEQCLAFRVPVIYGGYANVVDVKKLDQFSASYNDIEPMCARSFDFGWRVKVNEINKEGNIDKTWSFGTKSFSRHSAFRQGITTNMPIAIRYSNYDIRPGKLEIEIVDGELEQLAGFLDGVCHFKQNSGMNIVLSDEVYRENNNNICMGQSSNKVCKRLLCEVQINSLTPGSHHLNANYQNETIIVVS